MGVYEGCEMYEGCMGGVSGVYEWCMKGVKCMNGV